MAGEAPKEPPPTPSPHALAASLGPQVAGRGLLVGTGQFSPWASHARVGVVAFRGREQPETLYDGFMPVNEVEELAVRLNAWEGEFDFMYATPWHYAWTRPPAPTVVLDDADGEIVRVDGDEVILDGRHRVARADVTGVEAALSADWTERTVRVQRRGGEPVTVACQIDPIALIDPTYDSFYLSFETAWACQLAHVLGKALAVPVTVDPLMT